MSVELAIEAPKKKRKVTKKVYDCNSCKLDGIKVRPQGVLSTSEVLIVTEPPNDIDFKYNKPISGRAGRLLNNSLVKAGFDLSKCYTTSIILCKLPKRKDPTLTQIKSCGVNIVEIIDNMPNLKLIITSGKWPLKFFLNKSGVRAVRGELFKKDKLNIFPIYDPSFILDNLNERPSFEKDLRRAKEIVDGTIKQKEIKFKLCKTEQDLYEAKEKLFESKLWSCDVESRGGEHGLELFGTENFLTTIAFTTDKKENICIPIDHPESEIKNRNLVIKIVREIMGNSSKKIFHHAKFDIKAFKKLLGIDTNNLYFDTALASALLNQGTGDSNKLKRLAIDLLGYPSDYGIIGDNTELDKESLYEVARYNCEDTENTFLLYEIFNERLKELKFTKLFHNLVMDGCEAIIDMELTGSKIDVTSGKKVVDRYDKIVNALLKKLFSFKEVNEIEEFNINSNDQLAVLLFDKFKLPVIKETKSGKRSTDIDVLKALESRHTFIKYLLTYKKYEKAKNTYIENITKTHLKSDGKLHCSYNQDVTRTGRLSSSNMNLQNIPSRGKIGKDIKKLFIPSYKNSYILQADYSQIELRVAAIIANEPRMLEIYGDDGDIHTATAAAVLKKDVSEVTSEDRSKAKPVNFGFLYGQSAKGFVAYAKKSYGVEFTLNEAEVIRKNYFDTYAGLEPWYERVLKLARQIGYVETLFGRRRKLININGYNNFDRGKAERQAVNTPVQGTAGEMCVLAIYNINNILKKKEMRSRIINTVHDSIILECPEKELIQTAKIVRFIMENIPTPFEKIIPMKADLEYGRSWGSLSELKI